MPAAHVLLRSCQTNGCDSAKTASISRLKPEKLVRGVAPLVVKTWSPIRGTASMMASTCLDSGTLCGRLFFTRLGGSDHRSPATSSQRMPATSLRLWPVSSSTLMHGAIGPPTALHASHSALISASDRSEERRVG